MKDTMVGHYRIIEKIGSGGMGEVYKAKDTRLDRTVAIKVLPSQANMMAEARARFEREARTISSLNNPNICTLYDIGHDNGVDYLVMEYMEGETLEERLKRGRMETVEALRFGGQIAGALDAAHRMGVIHRDLKPGNIFLTKDGAKLLDFGLAKPHAEAVAGMSEETHTTPLTGAGTIVGTLQYMSPEQLEGGEADTRSDIFAFGATLYEMVTGLRAFSGTSKASLIGSIMKEEPRSISELQPTSPPALDRLIKKCLQKDPGERWQSAKDLKDEIDWITSAGSQAGIPVPVSSKRRFKMRLAWVVAAVCGIVAIVLGLQRITQETPAYHTMRFTISAPEEVARIEWPLLSPDGQYLAFVGYDSAGTSHIWIRPMNSATAHVLPGTENTWRPFWSPDSKWLAFFDLGLTYLKKVPVMGGQSQIICKTHGADGSWGKNDIILFDDYGARGIGQVSASGGQPKLAVAPDTGKGERYCTWPCFLPDGRHFIFTISEDSLSTGHSFRLAVGSIDDEETKVLGVVESRPIYCDPGYVLYTKNDFLVAQRLNFSSLELEKEAIPIADSITYDPSSVWGVNASASDNGTLIWKKGMGTGVRAGYLVWLNRNGEALDTVGVLEYYTDIELSPDNRSVAYVVSDISGSNKLKILELDREMSSPLASDDVEQGCPKWSPDGQAVAYAATDIWNFSMLRYCRVTDPKSITIGDSSFAIRFPIKWRKSGGLYYMEFHIDRAKESYQTKIFTVDINDMSRVQEKCTIPAIIFVDDISADGRYALGEKMMISDSAIYMYDMVSDGRRWRISSKGIQARWNHAGNEIIYFEDNDLMAVDINIDGEFSCGVPRRLFSRRHLPDRQMTIWGYDISSDGQRMLFISPADNAEYMSDDMEVMVNWDADLKK